MELIYFPFYEENRTPDGGSDLLKIAEVESGKCFRLTFVDSLLDSDIGGGRGQRALPGGAGGSGDSGCAGAGIQVQNAVSTRGWNFTADWGRGLQLAVPH